MDERSLGEKISDAVTAFGGSWRFILTGAGLITIWVFLNILSIFNVIAWDKYPFILLNLFLSLVAAFQAPFILMSQRRCEVKQDQIYRSLFREIKELVETDLSLEYEIVEKNKSLEDELRQVKELLREIKEKLENPIQ